MIALYIEPGELLGRCQSLTCYDVLRLQVYPDNLAPPQQILIDASNGASDYGNKFGEPLIAGYTRTFGQRLPNGERREWLKPIMFRWGRWLCFCRIYCLAFLQSCAAVSESCGRAKWRL
jgi:hypothetical protein